jgi:hypothetical protein
MALLRTELRAVAMTMAIDDGAFDVFVPAGTCTLTTTGPADPFGKLYVSVWQWLLRPCLRGVAWAGALRWNGRSPRHGSRRMQGASHENRIYYTMRGAK